MIKFVTHACEQVLRFTQVDKWNDLSEEVKIQLGFNMGVVALGLSLTKEKGFQILFNARQEIISMREFREHIRKLIDYRKIHVDEAQIARQF